MGWISLAVNTVENWNTVYSMNTIKKTLRINDKEENLKEKAYCSQYEAMVLGFNCFFSFGEGEKSAYMSNSHSQAKITDS